MILLSYLPGQIRSEYVVCIQYTSKDLNCKIDYMLLLFIMGNLILHVCYFKDTVLLNCNKNKRFVYFRGCTKSLTLATCCIAQRKSIFCDRGAAYINRCYNYASKSNLCLDRINFCSKCH